MDGVNKTLYIPLYGKAYVSQQGLFLKDEMAEQLWAKEGFPLKGKAKSKWLAYYMGIRAAVFDDWVREQTANMPPAIVLHVGCGLDSRVMRVKDHGVAWYDVDFAAVMEERKKYYAESENYSMIAADIRDGHWLDQILPSRSAIVVMEGVSMYLSKAELQRFMETLDRRFDRIALLMDGYTSLAAKLSGYRNPVHDVGVTNVYGLDDPTEVQQGRLLYTKEHLMTPKTYTDELAGMEKAVFCKLYAGKFSKKLYRLYEYQKTVFIEK
ncbi:MAG: class I SAM-dependent methyltransferase [Clostridia bacterium]|nr:class I SAM-dependent methyltransferase [Clostridia bacterium]